MVSIRFWDAFILFDAFFCSFSLIIYFSSSFNRQFHYASRYLSVTQQADRSKNEQPTDHTKAPEGIARGEKELGRCLQLE